MKTMDVNSLCGREETPVYEFDPLPSIYQVEVTSRCNLSCGLCPRLGRIKDDRDLNPEDLIRWIDRGDFASSYYVELQMAGEPLLYSSLRRVIGILKDKAGVRVGLSTNGSLLSERADWLSGVDAVTISVDSADPEEYTRLRPPAKLDKLLEGIDALIALEHRPTYIDLQAVVPINMPDKEAEAVLAPLVPKYSGVKGLIFRYVRDCSAQRFGRAEGLSRDTLCINPWQSVSVRADGSVVSCCYVFDDNFPLNVYGNLNEKPLSELWGGDEVREMRKAQRSGEFTKEHMCGNCYLRSPERLHIKMLSTWVKK